MVKCWTPVNSRRAHRRAKYDYKYMCMPNFLPWCFKGGVAPPTFFGKDAKLPPQALLAIDGIDVSHMKHDAVSGLLTESCTS